MSISRGISRRWKSVQLYQRHAWRFRDKLAFVILGIARCGDFSSGGFISRFAKPLLPLLRLRPKNLNGYAVLVDAADPSHIDIFDEIVLDGVYDFSSIPFEPDCIVDCGGHIGIFSVCAAARYPSIPIHIYEPSPANTRILEQTMRAVESPVFIHQEAVSDHAGEATFYLANSCGGSLVSAVASGRTSILVKVIDFVAALSRLNSERLLLKMDIEGEEEQLVPLLLPILPAHCAIFFETHSGDVGWSALFKEMTDCGFRVSLIRDRGKYKDAFAIRTRVLD